MGFELAYTDESRGLTVENAYYKVLNLHYQTNTRIYFQVAAFAERGKQVPLSPVMEFHLAPPQTEDEPNVFAEFFTTDAQNPLNSNIIKNIYDYLATRPEFEGAEPVLEEED